MLSFYFLNASGSQFSSNDGYILFVAIHRVLHISEKCWVTDQLQTLKKND